MRKVLAERLTGLQNERIEVLEHTLSLREDVLGSFNDVIWVIDQEMNLLYFNEAFSQVVKQISNREIKIGDSGLEAGVGEEAVAVWKENYNRALAGEKIIDHFHRTFGSKEFNFEVFLTPIYEYGKIVYVACRTHNITERKRAYDIMEHSEAKYRRSLERINSSYIAFDQDWRVSYVNKKAADVWKKDANALIGKVFWEEVPDAVGGPFYKALHQARENGKYVYTEEYYEPWDTWFADYIYPDEEGVSVFFHDVTEHKKNLQLLKEKETLLAKVYESTNDRMGICKITDQGELKLVSLNKNSIQNYGSRIRGIEELYGLELKAFIEKVSDLDQDTIKKVEKIFFQVLQSGKSIQHQLSFKDEAAGNTYIEVTLNPIENDPGIFEHILWVARDVTEQKVNEKKLRDNQQQLNLIYNSTSEMMALIRKNKDGDYLIKSANLSFLQMVQITRPQAIMADLEGARLDDVLPNTVLIENEASYVTTLSRLNKCLEKQSRMWLELSNFKSDIVLAFELEIKPVQVEGASPHLLVTITDLTDKIYKAEKTLIEINKALEKERTRVAAELHDSLTQTLSVASINLKNLRYDFSSIAEQDKYQKALKYLENGIEESRSIAHRIMPKAIRDFGLIPSIGELIENVKNVHKEEIIFRFNRNVRLSSELEINLFRIVQQTISNVFTHAQASLIEISLQIEELYIELCIEDDGIGVDFDPLDSVPGGIGIRTMRSRAKQLGGMFQIENRKDKGTRIYVKIPLTLKVPDDGVEN